MTECIREKMKPVVGFMLNIMNEIFNQELINKLKLGIYLFNETNLVLLANLCK